MTTQPIELRVTRFRCPFCMHSRAKRQASVDHIGRCWHNPAMHGCKSCKHFEQDPGDPEVGLDGGEFCAVDVDLSGDGDEIEPGPIVHCEKWEASA